MESALDDVPPVEPGANRNHLVPRSDSAPRAGVARLAAAVAVAATAAGVALRWWPRSALWLDEAQSVAFASLPLDEIPGALREDGAPPAYYLLLHGWMGLVGRSDASVRALSAVLATVTLVVVAVVVRRRWGDATAFAAVVLLGTSPFAIRYATHARMYSLVVLQVVIGAVLVDRALRRPGWARLSAVTLLAAALLLTHYWALYLVATTAAVLWIGGCARSAPSADRRARRRTALAVLTGFVLWAPWAPMFLFQSRHTATPWAAPANAATALQAFASSGEGPSVVAVVLCALVGGAFLAGLRTRGSGPLTVSDLGLVGAITAAAGVAGAIASSSAVSSRYFAVAVPLVLLTAAAGVAQLTRTWRTGLLAVLSVLGLWLAADEASTSRTTAFELAGLIAAGSRAGDRVIYCPDQLAPAMHRLLADGDAPPRLHEHVYPIGSRPDRVDWIDYTARAEAADPDAFADALLGATDTTIWLVVSTTYPPTQRPCSELLRSLRSSPRPSVLLRHDRPELVEHGALWRFDPAPRADVTS